MIETAVRFTCDLCGKVEQKEFTCAPYNLHSWRPQEWGIDINDGYWIAACGDCMREWRAHASELSLLRKSAFEECHKEHARITDQFKIDHPWPVSPLHVARERLTEERRKARGLA